MEIRPYRTINRKVTKKIKVGNKTDYVLRPDYIKEFQLLEN